MKPTISLFDWYDKGHAQLALEVGIISPSDFQGFIMYKVFLDVRAMCKSQNEALMEVAEQFKTSESSVFRAISKFRNDKTDAEV